MIALLSFLLSLRIAWKLAGFPFCPYDLVIPNCGRMNRNTMCASTLNILYLRLKLASSYNKNNASCNIHERWTAHAREWCAVNVR
jgi:hypothetical protein